MSDLEVKHECSLMQRSLEDRVRRVGMLLVTCRLDGEVVHGPPRGRDWLADLVTRSPLVRQALERATHDWASQREPDIVEALPGLWFAPLPILERRNLTGFHVAVIPTAQILASEHLHAMCQSARLDFEVCARLLAELPPAAGEDVPRLVQMIRDAHGDCQRLASEALSMESVGQQLAESYEEMNLLYTIIQSMTVVERPDRFVEIACGELLATLPYQWIGMVFVDDPQRLKRLAGRFIVAGRQPGSPEDAESAARLLLSRAQPDAPLVLEPAINSAHAEYLPLGRTALAHPISADGVVLGLLMAGDKRGDDAAASSVDMKLLGATASHTAIFVENAALYDDLNAMFLGTLEALTASIDAKDRYTCGHSRRVAHLTRQLARAVGLDEHTISRMHIAGLVRNVGKIGVPERVLIKPGKLNEEEFAWIRKHPEMGYRILKDIPQLEDVLPGVLYHHERWDGQGYPMGLFGEEIPLVARLITLADSFDAMSSTRTYRTRLSRADVLREITRCAGTQFDPELAPVFAALDFSEFDRLVEEHQASETRKEMVSAREEAA